jgi:hypothetical protein
MARTKRGRGVGQNIEIEWAVLSIGLDEAFEEKSLIESP